MKLVKRVSFKSILLIIVSFLIGGAVVKAQKEKMDKQKESAKPVTVEVAMKDYAFIPDTIRVPAGTPVKLKFINKGEKEHEFMAGTKRKSHGFETDLFKGIKVSKKVMGKEAEHEKKGKKDKEEYEHEKEGKHKEGHEEKEHHKDKMDEEKEYAHKKEHEKHAGEEGHHEHAGTMIELAPGQTGFMRFTLPESKKGTYSIACFEEMGKKKHFQLGMKGTLIVN